MAASTGLLALCGAGLLAPAASAQNGLVPDPDADFSAVRIDSDVYGPDTMPAVSSPKVAGNCGNGR